LSTYTSRTKASKQTSSTNQRIVGGGGGGGDTRAGKSTKKQRRRQQGERAAARVMARGTARARKKKSAGTGVLQKHQKFRDEENPVFKNQGRQNRSFPFSKFYYAC
jgi:hypothetical protein